MRVSLFIIVSLALIASCIADDTVAAPAATSASSTVDIVASIAVVQERVAALATSLDTQGKTLASEVAALKKQGDAINAAVTSSATAATASISSLTSKLDSLPAAAGASSGSDNSAGVAALQTSVAALEQQLKAGVAALEKSITAVSEASTTSFSKAKEAATSSRKETDERVQKLETSVAELKALVQKIVDASSARKSEDSGSSKLDQILAQQVALEALVRSSSLRAWATNITQCTVETFWRVTEWGKTTVGKVVEFGYETYKNVSAGGVPKIAESLNEAKASLQKCLADTKVKAEALHVQLADILNKKTSLSKEHAGYAGYAIGGVGAFTGLIIFFKIFLGVLRCFGCCKKAKKVAEAEAEAVDAPVGGEEKKRGEPTAETPKGGAVKRKGKKATTGTE